MASLTAWASAHQSRGAVRQWFPGCARLVGVAQAAAGPVLGGQRPVQVLVFSIQIKAKSETAIPKIDGVWVRLSSLRPILSLQNGMTCIRPCAPTRETAQRSKALFTSITNSISTGGKLSSIACWCTRNNRSRRSAESAKKAGETLCKSISCRQEAAVSGRRCRRARPSRSRRCGAG